METPANRCDTAKAESLLLSEAVFFEPGCFYPKDPFHEARLRAIILCRTKRVGHPLTLSELKELVVDLADGKVGDAAGGEYSARLAVRITQRIAV